MNINLNHLRKQLRKNRRQLSGYEQKKAATQVCQKLVRHPKFKYAQKVGLYLDAFGEIQTKEIIEQCFHLKKILYFPMICPMNRQLVWVNVSRNQYNNRRFAHHFLGMNEPKKARGQSVSHLDILIMPLLACDITGTRIGMGGGFYDRTLAQAQHRPFRLGIAHQFQYLDSILPHNAWDQALDALITPNRQYAFSRRN